MSKTMHTHYILDDNGQPQPCDMLTWAAWFETADRKVALTEPQPGVEVSTVFLGWNHRVGDKGPPLIYETMVFGGERDGYCERSSTQEEALNRHEAICKLVNSNTN